MTKEINIIIRIMPTADDIEVSLPLDATPKDVIDALLDAGLGIPKLDDQGNPISYKLVPKEKGQEIPLDNTLMDAEVQESDVVLMLPMVWAG